jgi:N-carbamoyl-L-amino-acid hydrolase
LNDGSPSDVLVAEQEALAASLFGALRQHTARGLGIHRDAYGDGENLAHRLIADAARRLGLAVSHDAAANTYMTLPGRNPGAPRVIVGSHLDSVADGGNFDGAAGVVAGLVAAAALKAAGTVPERDITVMAIRAEESVWFSTTYFGSRAAFGIVPPDVLERKRHDTGRTLRDHLQTSGGDPQVLLENPPHLDPARIAAFVEVHIEQGPILQAENCPIGLVTGIRGNYRHAAARIIGQYDHCGGVPRGYRHDAVVAASDFVQALERLWEDFERDGKDMAFTVGKLFTDPAQHALTKIPGEVTFSLDLRSVDAELLGELERRLIEITHGIEQRRGVAFELGPATRAEVGNVDPKILRSLTEGAKQLGIPARAIASGASHDAATFAQQGIPMGMIFVRNAHGSHNPQESMEVDDLMKAAKLLTWWLAHEWGDR